MSAAPDPSSSLLAAALGQLGSGRLAVDVHTANELRRCAWVWAGEVFEAVGGGGSPLGSAAQTPYECFAGCSQDYHLRLRREPPGGPPDSAVPVFVEATAPFAAGGFAAGRLGVLVSASTGGRVIPGTFPQELVGGIPPEGHYHMMRFVQFGYREDGGAPVASALAFYVGTSALCAPVIPQVSEDTAGERPAGEEGIIVGPLGGSHHGDGPAGTDDGAPDAAMAHAMADGGTRFAVTPRSEFGLLEPVLASVCALNASGPSEGEFDRRPLIEYGCESGVSPASSRGWWWRAARAARSSPHPEYRRDGSARFGLGAYYLRAADLFEGVSSLDELCRPEVASRFSNMMALAAAELAARTEEGGGA